MDENLLTFFPFSYIINNARHAGYQYHWPIRCDSCTHQCEVNKSSDLSMCSHGINYCWLSDKILVFGLIVASFKFSSDRHNKLLKKYKEIIITEKDFIKAKSFFQQSEDQFNKEIDWLKMEIIKEYKSCEQYKVDFLKTIRPEIQNNLSFLHDYKQFISRVQQNINVIIESHQKTGSFEQKLSNSSAAEKSIYWASRLMYEKLETAYLLLHPERITDRNSFVCFRLHGLVTKYLRIYESSFVEKGVKLCEEGASYGEILGNPIAVGVIPHTFIDNALKYSKRNSIVTVSFNEDNDKIVFCVSSYGPRIEDDEKQKIFELFYRGKAARKQEEEGEGFGLYLAQFVAKEINTKIDIKQSPSQKEHFGHLTTFSITFRREK